MERRLGIWLHLSFYSVISLNKTPLKSFLISSELTQLNLHYRHRVKIHIIKKEHVRTLNSTPLAFSVQFCTMNNFAELQLLPMME